MKSRSWDCKSWMCTLLKRFKKDLGSPLRPPPSCRGFCAAKRWKEGGHLKVCPSSAIKTSALWSSTAFKPSSTLCPAKFSSSSRTQLPAFMAANRGPSHLQDNSLMRTYQPASVHNPSICMTSCKCSHEHQVSRLSESLGQAACRLTLTELIEEAFTGTETSADTLCCLSKQMNYALYP